MRNMAVLHSPAFSYPLPVLVRVLFNLLIFKGKILYYNKYNNYLIYFQIIAVEYIDHVVICIFHVLICTDHVVVCRIIQYAHKNS